MEVFHIVIVGVGRSGKSALTVRYIQRQYVPDYYPTIEDAYRTHVNWAGSDMLVDILDTGGREDFVAARTSWMKDKDIMIILFVLNNEESLWNVADDIRK